MAYRPRFILLALAVLLAPLVATAEDQAKAKPENSQAFKKQGSYKGAYLSVYNANFAETFDLPQSGIEPKLKNIEAAIFRIEDDESVCGLDATAESCKQNYRCMLDIYVDESKHPLPWSTDQKADWETNYTSLKLLFDKRYADNFDSKGKRKNFAAFAEVDGGFVSPFAHPQTHTKAEFYENSRTRHIGRNKVDNEALDYSYVDMFGYRRHAIAGLTMLALRYDCNKRSPEKKQVNYRLADSEPSLESIHNGHRFFEFDLPEQFLNFVNKHLETYINVNDVPD